MEPVAHAMSEKKPFSYPVSKTILSTRYNDFPLLEDAKQWLREKVRTGGARCPCCQQFAKVYTRKLNAGMAVRLIDLYKMARDGQWVHRSDWNSKRPRMTNADTPYLFHWGLIEPKTTEKNETLAKVAGYWRITRNGVAFVDKELQVPEKVKLYDNRLLGFDGGLISIEDALNTKFNYKELMAL